MRKRLPETTWHMLRMPLHVYQRLDEIRDRLERDLRKMPGHKPAFYRIAMHDVVAWLIEVSGPDVAFLPDGDGSKLVRHGQADAKLGEHGQMAIRAYDDGTDAPA